MAAVGAALLAGCGSDKEGKPIPARQASDLQRELTAVERRFAFGDGACNDIGDKSEPAVQRILNEIPRSTDKDVRDALRQSFDRLWALSADQCNRHKNAKTTPEPTTPTPTTPPPTTTTETQTTETQTTETQPTDTNPKPKENKKPGGGKGGKQSPPGGGDGGSQAPGGG